MDFIFTFKLDCLLIFPSSSMPSCFYSLIYPYVVSSYTNGFYGLIIMLIFTVMLSLGFAFELGKNALRMDSKQNKSSFNKGKNYYISYVGKKG